MAKLYKDYKEGTWQKADTLKMACCDCSLVHHIEFRIHDGEMQYRAFRDNRATGQLRRWRRDENAAG